MSVNGAANSHASILTRAMGIPAIWGIEDVPLLQFEGKQMILDAYAGRLLHLLHKCCKRNTVSSNIKKPY